MAMIQCLAQVWIWNMDTRVFTFVPRRKDCEHLSLLPDDEKQRPLGMSLSLGIVRNCFPDALKLSNRRHATGVSTPTRPSPCPISLLRQAHHTIPGKQQGNDKQSDSWVTEINCPLKELGPPGKAGARG